MSKSFGNLKEDDGFASEGNDGPKKTSKTDDSDESDGIFVCEISKNRRVAVRNCKGKVVVDIREFYVEDGKQMPGKKGISLTLDQWKLLREHEGAIDKAVAAGE